MTGPRRGERDDGDRDDRNVQQLDEGRTDELPPRARRPDDRGPSGFGSEFVDTPENVPGAQDPPATAEE